MKMMDKAFEEFVVKECSDIIGTGKDIPKEQLKIIMFAYKRGFMDALRLLEAENIIGIQVYT